VGVFAEKNYKKHFHQKTKISNFVFNETGGAFFGRLGAALLEQRPRQCDQIGRNFANLAKNLFPMPPDF
jgi:hypothetical protein